MLAEGPGHDLQRMAGPTMPGPARKARGRSPHHSSRGTRAR